MGIEAVNPGRGGVNIDAQEASIAPGAAGIYVDYSLIIRGRRYGFKTRKRSDHFFKAGRKRK